MAKYVLAAMALGCIVLIGMWIYNWYGAPAMLTTLISWMK